MNHQQAWDLIPWFVNDSIDPAQREELEQHVAGCAQCNEEIEAQRALLQAMLAGPRVEAMPRASLRKLWARVDAEAELSPRAAASPVPRRLSAFAWLISAAACLALLLGASWLAVLRPGQDQRAAEFRTVADAAIAPAAGDIRAVFAGEMTLAELQKLLDGTGLRVVAGPSPSGVYTLGAATAPADPKAALAALRAHPAVRFAEPVGH